MGRYFIFCNECALKVAEDEGTEGVFLALFGPQGLTDEDAMLVCLPWEDRVKLFESEPFACDECGIMVAVAPSSKWFVERHKEQHE